MALVLLPLATACPETVEGTTDARVRMPADLGDISGRGCATGTVDLRTIEGVDTFLPFCAAESFDCVLACMGDRACEAACVEADETRSISLAPRLELSGCVSCFAIQRNACVTASCPEVSAQLTCCIEAHPECASDRGCSACGDRWDAFEACRATADCLLFQQWCFTEP